LVKLPLKIACIRVCVSWSFSGPLPRSLDMGLYSVEKKLQEGKLGASEVVEQILQNKLSTSLTILAETRQRITTREVKRGPHKDREQRERLRDIATLQIALSVLKRPTGKGNGDQERHRQARDGTRRKIQSWAVI